MTDATYADEARCPSVDDCFQAPLPANDQPTDGMTQDDIDRVYKFITWAKAAINLDTGWDVTLSVEDADEGSWATVVPIMGRMSAQIFLCKEWATLPDETQALVLVHELMHLHHRDVYEVYRIGVHSAGYLPQRVYDGFARVMMLEFEKMVDRLSVAFVASSQAVDVWAKLTP